MKNFSNTIPAILAALVLLQGCTSTIYHFDAAEYFKSKNYNKEMPFTMRGGNVGAPLLGEIDDKKITTASSPKNGSVNSNRWFKHNHLNLSSTLAFNGGDFRIAYSPAKRLMFVINVTSISKSSSEKGYAPVAYTRYEERWVSDGWFGGHTVTDTLKGIKNIAYEKKLTLSQNQTDFSIGYYSSFGGHGIYEAISGWGQGSAENEYKYSSKENTGYSAAFSERRNFYQIFLQNNLGYATARTEGALCARLTYQRFTSQSFVAEYEIPKYAMEKVNVLIEPALHFGYGGKKLKGFFDYGFVIPLGNSDVEWGPGTFRLGVSFKI